MKNHSILDRMTRSQLVAWLKEKDAHSSAYGPKTYIPPESWLMLYRARHMDKESARLRQKASEMFEKFDDDKYQRIKEEFNSTSDHERQCELALDLLPLEEQARKHTAMVLKALRLSDQARILWEGGIELEKEGK